MRPFILCISCLELSENVAEVNLLADDSVEILDLNALLLHAVAMTDSYAAVVKRLVVDSNAERSTDCVLTAISLTD